MRKDELLFFLNYTIGKKDECSIQIMVNFFDSYKQKEILKDSETFEKVANGNRGLHVPAPVEAGMEETHLTPNIHIYLNNFYLKDFSIYLF